MNEINYFVFYIEAPLVLTLGLIGNLTGLVMLSVKKDNEIKPKEMFFSLFLFDTLMLISILIYYLKLGFAIDLLIHTSLICKAAMYVLYSLASVSSMILVYILIERLLSVKFPVESNMLRMKLVQFTYLLIMIVFNFIYYLPVPFNYDIVKYKNITGCFFINSDKKIMISNLTITHKLLLPSGLMVIFSTLLIYSIFKSKSRVLTLYSRREIEIFNNDVHLSIMSFVCNCIFIGLNLPFAIVLYFFKDYSDFLFLFTLNLFYLSYGVNFYLFLIFNSMFRNKFKLLFR